MNAIPQVTIGITCFNAEDTILRAIDSALGQTYSNTEVIIVDDASTDNSVKLISKLVDEIDKLTLIKHDENKGAPSAYNTIVKNAKGKYICFFDDDDFSHEDRVEKTVQALELKDSKDLVCYCDRYVIRGDEKNIIKGLTRTPASSKDAMEHMLDTLCYQYDRPYYRKHQKKFVSLKKHNLTGSSAGTGIMTAPTDILKKHLFDPKMYRFCDTELNLRMFQDGVGSINIDEPLMTQYVTSGTDKTSVVEKQSAFHALTKHKKTYQSYSVFYPSIFSVEDELKGTQLRRNQSEMPLVTIGIVTENSENSIFDVIQSAFSQTYKNTEIIIVDNSSTDSTLDILSRIDDPRLSIRRNKNKASKSQNYNEILSNANSEFTVFFDDKDIALTHRVERQIDALLERNDRNPLLSIADYYDNTNINQFVGVHHCLGNLGNVIDADTLKDIIWYIVVRHSESKYLLTDYSIPFFEYSLFPELVCGRTEILMELGFDKHCPDNLAGLGMLTRFSESGGKIINKREPLIQKQINPLRCGRWPEVVEESNTFIQVYREKFEKAFGVNPELIINRNKLKNKLLKRMSLIKKII